MRSTQAMLGAPAAPGRSADTMAAPAVRSGVEVSGTDIIFAGYLLLIVLEYVGVSTILPILKVTRFSTLLAYGVVAAVLFRIPKFDVFGYRQTKLLAAFVALSAASMAWAVVTTYAFQSIRPHVDYFGFFVTTVYLIDRSHRINRLCVVTALVLIGLVARNVDKLVASNRQGAFLAGYFLGDGNDFGWGLNVMLPLAVYLVIAGRGMLQRGLGVAAALACAFGVVGTQSRGATLAIGASFLYYLVFVSRRRTVGVVALVVLAVGVLAFAPSAYFDRMASIENVQEDGSAQGRIRAWTAATKMALDYPLGVGAENFNAAYGRFYAPTDYSGWGSQRWISAHSVYFKVLGEYGFPGLALILWLIVSNFRQNIASRRRIKANPSAFPVPETWPAMLNMGMVGYCVSAIFLGGLPYPHLYLLTGLTLSCARMVACEQAVSAAVPASAVITPTLSFRPPRDRQPQRRFNRAGSARRSSAPREIA